MIGHKKQIDFFINSYKNLQLGHAYFLQGTEGIGKKTFAIDFGMGILCEKGSFFENCQCPSCKQVRGGIHPDFYIFESKDDPKKENQLNIKSVRKIPEISEMTSYKGGWKVIIFDDVHLLSHGSGEGGNALLKSLEEPGEKTVFFLISHKPEKVLPTIKSRCINVKFDNLSKEELRMAISNKGYKDFENILSYAEGSVLKAMFLKDNKIDELIEALKIKKPEFIGEKLFNLQDKVAISIALEVIIDFFMKEYKNNESNVNLLPLIEDLNEFLSRLEYNININIQLLDIFARILGAI